MVTQTLQSGQRSHHLLFNYERDIFKRHPERHVSRLYERLSSRKVHGKAIGAVARHLAEATYWVLKKKVPYRDPSGSQAVLPTKG